MVRIVRYFVAFFILAVFCACGAAATDEGPLHGRYSYRNQNLSVEFVLGDAGVSNARVNSHEYKNVRWNDHGVFGNTAFYEIEFENSNGQAKFVQLLIFFSKGKVLRVSGFYAAIKYAEPDEDVFEVKFLRSMEMSFTPASILRKQRSKK